MNVAWTADAERELDEIWEYIAQDNLDAADRQIERLRAASLQLAVFPRIGRPGRKAKTRELVVSGTNYILIYRMVRDTVEILRIRHGRQKWPPGS